MLRKKYILKEVGISHLSVTVSCKWMITIIVLMIQSLNYVVQNSVVLESMGRWWQFAFLSTHCMGYWEIIYNYQYFHFRLEGDWELKAEIYNPSFQIIQYLSEFLNHVKLSWFTITGKRKIYSNLWRGSGYDICWNNFLRVSLSRRKFLESQSNRFQNLFHLCLADHILSFHILHFCHFN